MCCLFRVFRCEFQCVGSRHQFWSHGSASLLNMFFKIQTSKPSTHWNMLSFDQWPNTTFDAWETWCLKHKTCKVSRFMFWRHVHMLHVPQCKTHPCPIHNILNLFQLSHTWSIFLQTILSGQLGNGIGYKVWLELITSEMGHMSIATIVATHVSIKV